MVPNIKPAGTAVLYGDRVHLRNMMGIDPSYLDACGNASCDANSVYKAITRRATPTVRSTGRLTCVFPVAGSR